MVSWSENESEKIYNDKDEFIAIAEGKDVPIYFFTYNLEMTQFIYTDLISNQD
jgi:hypothetical protein